MIYTSYFARAKDIDSDKYTFYSITSKKVAWFNGKHLAMLAPKYDLVCAYKEHRITEEQYRKYYIQYLDEHEIEVLDIIRSLPENSVLFCYERYLFCHRHVLAEWLNKKGIDIKEFKCREKKETI